MSGEQLLAEAIANLPNGFRLDYELNADRASVKQHGQATLVSPGGLSFSFSLEVKKIHRKESFTNIVNNTTHVIPAVPLLLVCNQLTPALTEYCHTNHLNFIDTAGNAGINVPGLCVLIEGKTTKKIVAPKSRLAEGVMKLLFVLLSRPESLNETYRTLAVQAGISLGMVSKAFEYLAAQKYYRKTQSGRRLMNAEELLVLWLRDYASALLPKLSGVRVAVSDLWQDIALSAGEYWSGEVAAAELSDGYLIPEKGQIFTPCALSVRCKELGFRPMRDGQLQLISSFWGRDFQLNEKAKVMLCVADLLASDDDRNKEAARIINDKYLKLSDTALFSY